MSVSRDTDTGTGTNLADILTSALPPDALKKEDLKSDSSNGSGETSESASVSSVGSNSSSKAPGAQLSNKQQSSIFSNNHATSNDFSSLLQQQQLLSLDSNSFLSQVDKTSRKGVYFGNVHSNGILGSYLNSDTVESVVGNALDDISLEDPVNLASIDRDLEADSPVIPNSITAGLASTGLLGSSDPVNIPGSGLSERNNSSLNFSPNASSPLNHIGFLSSRYQQDTIENSSFMGQTHLQSKMGNFQTTGIYDFGQNVSPHHPVSHSPLVSSFTSSSPGTMANEVQRLHNEVFKAKQTISQLEQLTFNARSAMELLTREAEDQARTASIAEKQRDEAISQAKSLQKEVESLQKSPYLHSLRRVPETKCLPMAALKQIQSQLRTDLDEVDKLIYQKSSKICMVCEEMPRSVTLVPCNHFVLCSQCAGAQKECPYCQTPLQPQTTHAM